MQELLRKNILQAIARSRLFFLKLRVPRNDAVRFPFLYSFFSNQIKPAACCFIFLIGISLYSVGQKRPDWKERIDLLIDEIDSLALKTQRTFIVTKYLKNNDPYKETWHYTMRDEKVIYFEIRYVIATHEFTEIYYVDRNHPICMEQYESPYLGYYIDELIDGKMYFIDNNNVRLHVTLGRKPAESKYPHRGLTCLEQFDKRFTELRKTMQYLE